MARFTTPEQLAGAIGSIAVGDCLDPLVRRAGIKLAAERFGFTVSDEHGHALRTVADELGVELPAAPVVKPDADGYSGFDRGGAELGPERDEELADELGAIELAPAPRGLAPIDQDGRRTDAPELHPFSIAHAEALRWIREERAVRVGLDRFEIAEPDPAEAVGHGRALELLRIVSSALPGRPGWRRTPDGREWYSADWLGLVS